MRFPKPASRQGSQHGFGRLLRRIDAVLTESDSSFAGLTKAAGLDPSKDFRNISLNGLPLDKQDLSGFDLSGSDLRNTGVHNAARDGHTKFRGAAFDLDGPSLDPDIIAFNKRLKELSTSDRERELRAAVSKGAGRFDVISFNAVMKRARNLQVMESFYDLMRKTHIKPNEFILNNLVGRAETEASATRWYDEMQKLRLGHD